MTQQQSSKPINHHETGKNRNDIIGQLLVIVIDFLPNVFALQVSIGNVKIDISVQRD